MANLSGQNIGTNYKGILNLNTLNGNLTTTLQAVTDGDGNASPLRLSITKAIVAGSLINEIIYGVYNSTLTSGIGFFNSNSDDTPVWSLVGGNDNRITMFSNEITIRAGGVSMGQFTSGALTLGGGGFLTPLARLHVRGDGTNPSFRSENSAATQGFIHSVVGDINNLFLGRFADTSVAGNIFYDNSSGLLTISNNYTPAPNFGFINLLHGQTSVRIQNGTTPLSVRVSGTSVFNVNSTGAVAIGNAVTAAVGVASTHKVTVVIGGVTYFLLASDV
jgi:hypothetical protein